MQSDPTLADCVLGTPRPLEQSRLQCAVPEHCLLCPPRTIHNLAPRRLLLAQCMNHIFRNTIATSPALQERLFLQPMHKSLNVQLPNLDGPREPLFPRGRVHNVLRPKHHLKIRTGQHEPSGSLTFDITIRPARRYRRINTISRNVVPFLFLHERSPLSAEAVTPPSSHQDRVRRCRLPQRVRAEG